MAVAAQFHGGPLDGEYRALPEKRRWWSVPLPPRWYPAALSEASFDPDEVITFGVGRYEWVAEHRGLHHYAMYRRVR